MLQSIRPTQDAKNNFPNATFTLTNTFFHGASAVITPDQIAWIKKVADDSSNTKKQNYMKNYFVQTLCKINKEESHKPDQQVPLNEKNYYP